MRMQIPLTALGLALVAGAPAANAQTVITEPSGTLMAQEPLVPMSSGTLTTLPVTVQTVETVQTVRTVRRPVVHRQVITTRRTVVRQRIVPTQTVVSRSTYSQPLYDQVGPSPLPVAPGYQRSYYDRGFPAPVAAGPYSRPLYDAVMPASDDSFVSAPVAAPGMPSGTAYSFYRYVYEPDRILVIDPNTNIAVQAIPR